MISSLVGVNVPAALAEHAAIIEEAIDMLLPLPEGPERPLIEAMRYATLGGGKRLRGFLVMETAALFAVAPTCAARVAASVEMLHAYSLVHDDLPAMDDDDLRRGKPSTHRAFDEATAILAGDALQTRAFEILAESDTHSDPQARCELVAGDFFESVPAGGDAYIMKHIIHDWDDERSISILRNCHRAMKDGGRLLLVEMVIAPGNEPSLGKLMDINMLILPGGLERTEAEYRELFAAAGFRLTKIIPTASPVSIIEGVK